MKFIDLIKISRPRFWIYELGTFFIGYLLAAKSLSDFYNNIDFIIFFIYFLFPANLLIYGINDIFDYETDKINPKKINYEKLLTPDKHKIVYIYILSFNLPFIIYALLRLELKQIIFLFNFLFFAIFYSAKPIRAKAKAFLDSFFSAGHYVFTGIFGYYLIYPNKDLPILVTIFGFLWSMAMHAYSAVPDINYDKQSNLNTIATFLGNKNTILLCLLLYILSFSILANYNLIFLVGAVPYLALMMLSLKFAENDQKLFRIYKIFPYLNTILPMIWCIYYIIFKLSYL
jgi:4-hydroxybenzoate polyprenyltransferase